MFSRSSLQIIVYLLLLNACARADPRGTPLASGQTWEIAERVFQNECGGQEECLLAWNAGEEFLSLGIGHFIWYPAGRTGPFEESFPQLIKYLRKTKTPIPAWLTADPVPACPWASREDFERNRQGRQAQELWQFLRATKGRQGDFIVARFYAGLPLMLKNISRGEREQLKKQFARVAGSTPGLYAMIDYVNFKGLGTAPDERYQGQGWGLRQVLLGMQGEAPGAAAVQEFARVAEQLLTERVAKAPPDRHEERWLTGWRNRVRSYAGTPGPGVGRAGDE